MRVIPYQKLPMTSFMTCYYWAKIDSQIKRDWYFRLDIARQAQKVKRLSDRDLEIECWHFLAEKKFHELQQISP